MLVNKSENFDVFMQQFHSFKTLNDEDDRPFETYVMKYPVESSKHASSIAKCSPQTQNDFLSGIRNVIDDKMTLDWISLLGMIELVSISGSSVNPDQDDAILNACGVLVRGLEFNMIDYSFKDQIINITNRMLEIGDAYNEPDFAVNDATDSLTRSINYIDGMSFHVLCRYLEWCHNNEKLDNTFTRDNKQIFEKYLDDFKNHTIARHSVMGFFFSWFFSIDKQWTIDIVFKKIQSSLPKLKISFWSSFVLFMKEKPLLIALSAMYDEFLNGTIISDLHNTVIYRDTIDHVVLGYLNDVDKFDEIFKKFIKFTDDESIDHCASVIACIPLRYKDISVFKDKINLLWKNTRFVESKYFEMWFKNNPFDKDNIDLFLNYAKTRTRPFPYSTFPTDRLGEYIDEYPIKVAECVNLLVGKHEYMTSSMMESLLYNLRKKNNPQVNKICDEINKKMLTFV